MDASMLSSIFVLLIGSLIYFLPTIVAGNHHHRNKSAIAVLNFFLGWTFIGWVVAMIWACTDNRAIVTN